MCDTAVKFKFAISLYTGNQDGLVDNSQTVVTV